MTIKIHFQNILLDHEDHEDFVSATNDLEQSL